MVQIPLHLIETFVIVGESQSLARAAGMLGQTQPSVSRQIERLQSYFKRPLFRTVGRTKKLTDYGQKLSAYYRKGIFDLRALQENLETQSFQSSQSPLRVAARPEILDKYINVLNFETPVELYAWGGARIREEMESSQIDVAVFQEHFESYNYFRKKLFSTEWCLAIPKKWVNEKSPTSRATTDWFNFLRDRPFATFQKNFNQVYPNAIKKISFNEFRLAFVAEDWRLIAARIERQACWSIVPREYTPTDKAIVIALPQYFKPFHFFVYFRKDLAQRTDVKNLMAQLRE